MNSSIISQEAATKAIDPQPRCEPRVTRRTHVFPLQDFSCLVLLPLLAAALLSMAPTAAAQSVSLTWTASTSPVIGYNAYRGTQSGGPYTLLNSSLISGTAYTDTTVQVGQTYYYVATAVNSNNVQSAYSNEAPATVPYPPVASQLAFTPGSVAFGNVPTGATSTQSVTLGNTGSQTVFVTGDTLTGASFSTSGLSVPLTLTGGQSTTFSVSFAPSAAGSFTGTLVAVSNASNSPTSLALSGTGTADGPTSISYVQGNYATPQTPQSAVSVTFTGTQAAGDLNLVVVGWNDTTATVSTVTDASGNTYTPAVGPTVGTSLSQSIYYAQNIAAAAAGANVVTVTFSTAATNPDIRILEYSGAAPSNPVDVTAAGSGSSSTSTSASATTTNPTDLIFGANIVATLTTGPGSGFAQRLLTSPDGDIAEDQMVTATGSYSATAPLSAAGPWIMQMVAFRTASGGGATLSASPASLAFGNVTVGSTSNPQTVTLTNTGTASVTVSQAAVTGNGFSFTGPTLPLTLTAGHTATFNVSFAPTAAGNVPGTLSLTSNATNSPTVATLSGTGVAPVATVSPLALTLSSPLNITSQVQSVTVTNTGTSALTINSISLSGTNSGQFAQTSNCPIGGGGLAAGLSCTISVTFKPTSAGTLTKTALLNVNVAAPATSQSVSLTGTIVVPTFTLLPTSLSFGNQLHGTTSPPQTATLTNTGSVAPLTINNIVLSGTNSKQFTQTNNCGTFPVTLTPGNSCTISVQFAPTKAGAMSASLTVRVAAPATNQSVSLTGTGQ